METYCWSEDWKRLQIPTALVHLPWAGWSELQSLQTGGWETCGGDDTSFLYFIMSYNRGSFFLTCSLNGITFVSFQSTGTSSNSPDFWFIVESGPAIMSAKFPQHSEVNPIKPHEFMNIELIQLFPYNFGDKWTWHSPSHSPLNLRPGGPRKQFINYRSI